MYTLYSKKNVFMISPETFVGADITLHLAFYTLIVNCVFLILCTILHKYKSKICLKKN